MRKNRQEKAFVFRLEKRYLYLFNSFLKIQKTIKNCEYSKYFQINNLISIYNNEFRSSLDSRNYIKKYIYHTTLGKYYINDKGAFRPITKGDLKLYYTSKFPSELRKWFYGSNETLKL